jgi:hypothetical protein
MDSCRVVTVKRQRIAMRWPHWITLFVNASSSLVEKAS